MAKKSIQEQIADAEHQIQSILLLPIQGNF